MNKYGSEYLQQQLFSATEDAVYTLASRAEGLFDAVTMSVLGSARRQFREELYFAFTKPC